MNKILHILLITVITIAVVVFIFFPPPWKSKDIKGCMDPLAKNYDPSASIAVAGSCLYNNPIPNEIIIRIDSLGDRAWDKDYYNIIGVYIEQYFFSKSKSGSSEEDNALLALDLKYMTVLNNETEKIVDNCFKDAAAIKSEVDDYYNKYKTQSSEIIKADSWFTTKSDITNLNGRVINLISKQYNEATHNSLMSSINALEQDPNYKNKMKNCNDFSAIINTAKAKLKDFEGIAVFSLKDFETAYIEYKNNWQKAGKVPDYWRNFFKDLGYAWYHNEVMKIDSQLKQGNE
jgi:hypothetical protein